MAKYFSNSHDIGDVKNDIVLHDFFKKRTFLFVPNGTRVFFDLQVNRIGHLTGVGKVIGCTFNGTISEIVIRKGRYYICIQDRKDVGRYHYNVYDSKYIGYDAWNMCKTRLKGQYIECYAGLTDYNNVIFMGEKTEIGIEKMLCDCPAIIQPQENSSIFKDIQRYIFGVSGYKNNGSDEPTTFDSFSWFAFSSTEFSPDIYYFAPIRYKSTNHPFIDFIDYRKKSEEMNVFVTDNYYRLMCERNQFVSYYYTSNLLWKLRNIKTIYKQRKYLYSTNLTNKYGRLNYSMR